MMRRLFGLLFKLAVLAAVVFLLTAIWILFDGLSDLGEKADVALVPGHAVLTDGVPGPVLKARLDRAIKLYNDGEFASIVVSGATRLNGYDEASAMSRYLQEHGVPASAIVEDHDGTHTQDSAANLAVIMKAEKLHSVMVVTDYYQITRTKLALRHEGVTEVQQAHVGRLEKKDAYMVGREVVALYDYLYHYYLMPEAKKITEKVTAEAKTGTDKIKDDAEKTKENVDKKIDSLSK